MRLRTRAIKCVQPGGAISEYCRIWDLDQWPRQQKRWCTYGERARAMKSIIHFDETFEERSLGLLRLLRTPNLLNLFSQRWQIKKCSYWWCQQIKPIRTLRASSLASSYRATIYSTLLCGKMMIMEDFLEWQYVSLSGNALHYRAFFMFNENRSSSCKCKPRKNTEFLRVQCRQVASLSLQTRSSLPQVQTRRNHPGHTFSHLITSIDQACRPPNSCSNFYTPPYH